MDCIVVGSGLCGITAARKLAETGKKVLIVEKRSHPGGNIYDFYNNDGVLVQKYGPHSFFTNNQEIKNFIESFVQTNDSFVECQTIINQKAIPMPFNFASIDLLYAPSNADKLKQKLKIAFDKREFISVTELLENSDPMIHEYGVFMYENEYRLYTAKQWGRPLESIDPSIFNRVPVYLSYQKSYQKHPYQFIPQHGFTDLVHKIVSHDNIILSLNNNALDHLMFSNDGAIFWDKKKINCPVLFTGPLDELFKYKYGILPYRSLEFIWKTFNVESYQDTAIVAYPQADKITRVTEYTKLPPQKIKGKTVVAVEIPFEYTPNAPFGNEPYYPVLTENSQKTFCKYVNESKKYSNLYTAGRLADFRYYNMDDAILRGWDIAKTIQEKFNL